MNMVTIAIGVAAFVFGVYTIYLRLTHPDKLGKLALMKEKFGEKPGNLIHLVGYSLGPLIFGIVMISTGINGASIF
jgi:hypothetical protein